MAKITDLSQLYLRTPPNELGIKYPLHRYYPYLSLSLYFQILTLSISPKFESYLTFLFVWNKFEINFSIIKKQYAMSQQFFWTFAIFDLQLQIEMFKSKSLFKL